MHTKQEGGYSTLSSRDWWSTRIIVSSFVYRIAFVSKARRSSSQSLRVPWCRDTGASYTEQRATQQVEAANADGITPSRPSLGGHSDSDIARDPHTAPEDRIIDIAYHVLQQVGSRCTHRRAQFV